MQCWIGASVISQRNILSAAIRVLLGVPSLVIGVKATAMGTSSCIEKDTSIYLDLKIECYVGLFPTRSLRRAMVRNMESLVHRRIEDQGWGWSRLLRPTVNRTNAFLD